MVDCVVYVERIGVRCIVNVHWHCPCSNLVVVVVVVVDAIYNIIIVLWHVDPDDCDYQECSQLLSWWTRGG